MKESRVKQFQQLYKEEYGEEIPYDVALEYAEKLVMIVHHIYKPIRKEDMHAYLQEQEEEV